jgi:serine/threonine-protein kinase
VTLDQERIRDQVQRILRSEQFGNAPGLEKALSYLVEQSLAGRGGELKEVILALEVFNRGAEFDPRTDSSVRTQIGRLRSRLSSYYDGPGRTDPIVIEIPKGAYAPVFSARDQDEPAAAKPVVPRKRSWPWLWIAAAVVMIGAIVWLASAKWRADPVSSLAVLPFLDLTPEHNYQFFSEGMAEEIIDALVQNDRLRVIARTSSFQYKGQDRDVRRIGSELNVDAVMEGSVRKDGNRLRITVQLNRARDGSHLWSQSFDLPAADLLAIQREISTSIAMRFSARNTQAAHAHPVDPETYRMFLEALYLFNREESPETMRDAAEAYRKVVARDGSYALAWAGLADACTYLAIFQTLRGAPQDFQDARDAAQRAISLNPRLAEAHAALAGIYLAHDWDWDQAERESCEAVSLSPGSSWAHHWMYHVHQVRGRLQEARDELEKSLSLDPTADILLADQTEFAFYRDDWDEAIQDAGRCLQFHPNETGCAFDRSLAFLQKGDIPAAHHNTTLPEPPPPLFAAFEAFASGQMDTTRRTLRQLVEDPSWNEPLYTATLYVLLGDWKAADQWLDRCYRARSPNLIFLHLVRDLQSDDPRYQAWLDRMKLPRVRGL